MLLEQNKLAGVAKQKLNSGGRAGGGVKAGGDQIVGSALKTVQHQNTWV